MRYLLCAQSLQPHCARNEKILFLNLKTKTAAARNGNGSESLASVFGGEEEETMPIVESICGKGRF